jgi:hypothetical protein
MALPFLKQCSLFCFDSGLGFVFHFLQDEDMHYEESNIYAMARTSNLNEELGQVRDSSKTGAFQDSGEILWK